MSKMFKSLAVAFIMLICSLSMYAQNQVVLKAGTPVVLETVTPVNSKTASVGSVVDFKVMNDVKAGNAIVIPAGTIAKGQVASVHKASALGNAGEMTIALNSVNAIDGAMVPLSGGTTSVIGKDKKGLSIVCGLCTLIGFLIQGEQAEIPAGTQIHPVVMTNTDITL